jgi:D-alanyl-D-alanine carboxypeptidase
MDADGLRAGLERLGKSRGPGLYALVTDGGEVVFEHAVGVADLREPRPIGGADRFRIGSVTKTYVSALVLQLVAEGVIGLGDPVPRWLPGVVPDADGITVAVLLRMRSGLPDYVPVIVGDPPDLSVLERYWAPRELVAAALSSADRIGAAERYRYCNTDYVLLGMVVEAATGERVDAQLWERVFRPLGLDDTTLPIVDPLIRGAHATGHLRVGGGAYQEFTAVSPSESWTAGGIVASGRDVAAFMTALLGGKVLDEDGLALMTTATEPLDGWRARGIGLTRYDFGGTIAYGHHGGVPGYTTMAFGTTGGRAVVIFQNCMDVPDILDSDEPYVAALVTA